jgi:isoamylase
MARPDPDPRAPLGPSWDGTGVEFRLWSAKAGRVELWTPDRDVRAMRRGDDGVWSVRVDGVGPGQRYGFVVDGVGPLCDPRARLLEGDPPVSVIADEAFDWGDAYPPRTPWTDTVIYECHVKGMTMLHPAVDPAERGTYLGLASPPLIEHLVSLGVTAVELLPVQHSLTEERLKALGLTNYWGYGTIGFFAPDLRFATAPGRQLVEFKEMVRRLHRAGIEVILDVVYNHTIEGGEDGPTLCWKGIDQNAHYRLRDGRWVDWTGCGNTLDFRHPRVRELVRDSLVYWARETHVDGFRFDLAPVLGRGGNLLRELTREPELAGIKLIAEPWDLGPDGYRLGRFPPGWSEWNDRYRDTVRRFWKGDGGQAPELASRLSGSVDLLARPHRSINYVVSHDGFTLRDLVSHSKKKNRDNGEKGRDGTNQNWSRDWGKLGGRIQKAIIATLALSRGVPMLAHGDELGRSQGGNNNPYCQDNEISWVDWSAIDEGLLRFTQAAFRARRDHPVLRQDAPYDPERVRWLAPDCRELSSEDWHDKGLRTFGVRIHDELLLLLNASASSRTFVLPEGRWAPLLETVQVPQPDDRVRRLRPHSLVLLVQSGRCGPTRPSPSSS